MEKKKIAFFINSLAAGGAEKVLALLVENLCHEFDIHLLLLNPIIEINIQPNTAKVKVIGGDNVKSGGVELLKLPLLAFRLKRYLKQHDISHCISFLNRPNFVTALARILGWKGRVILCERVHTSSHYNKATFSGKVGRWLVRNLYNHCDLLITNSQGMAVDLAKNFKIRRPIQVIYNYIDMAVSKQKAAEPVTDQSFDVFTFILSGRFHPQKNHALLLAAVKQIAHLPFKVLLVGKGELEEEVQQEIIDQGLQDKIFIVGFRFNPLSYVAKSHCLLMASHFEGFPNVLLEALACGTPVISTDCPTGPRELLSGTFVETVATDIEQLPYGILVPPNDKEALAKAMQMVMENPALLEQYKAVGPLRASEFDLAKTVNQFAAAINMQ